MIQMNIECLCIRVRLFLHFRSLKTYLLFFPYRALFNGKNLLIVCALSANTMQIAVNKTNHEYQHIE